MLASTAVTALTIRPDAPERYRVKERDTLWGIAERYAQNPWDWPEIWYQNDQIKNPHLIFPGDEIGLVKVDGKIRATVIKRGPASRTVKMHPSARVESIESAIPAIPMDAVRGFLRAHRVVPMDALDNAPRILSGENKHILMGAGAKVYARGDEKQAATAYSVFRKGQLYRDPQTGEVLGLEALDIGLAQVLARQGDILTLMLERTNQQVSVGDRLLPTEDRELISRFYPKAPEVEVSGQILAVSGGVTQVGQFDVVVLNRGARDRLEPGAVLVIKKAGAIVYDRQAGEKVRLPATQAGMLMVFRTFDKLSYALVMRSTQPLRVGDYFTKP